MSRTPAPALAPALASVSAWARAFDPSAPGHTWGQRPELLTRDLLDALQRSGIALDSVDRVVSGASGSRRGDRVEGRVLRGAFGDSLPPLVAPKAVTGEYAGGLLAPALLALAGRAFQRPIGFQQEDPDIGVRLCNVAPERAERVLMTSVAAGGTAAWLVLDAPR